MADSTRVAGYVRLSRETDSSTSPERQRALIAGLCQARGWELVDVFEDLGQSGGSTDRPALRRLRARLGEFDAVVFWKLDRLARSVGDFATMAQEAERAGTALVSATEPIDMTTPIGKAMAGVVSVFAELELSTIRERIRAGQAALLATGRWKGGARPFGWRPTPHPSGAGHWLALDPVEAPILREAIERALSGASLQSVAEWLNAEGVQSAQKGRAWSRTAIRHMLTRKGLLGHATRDGGTVFGDDGLPVLAAEPLLDRETFDRLQAAVSVRRRRATSGERPYLAGLAFCAHCGNRLWSKPRHRTLSSGERVTDRLFQCSAPKAADYTGPPCPGCAILADRLAAEVERLFLGTFGSWDVTERIETTDERSEDRADLLAALDDLGASLVGIRSETARRAILGQIEALDARLLALGPAIPPSVAFRATGETFGEVWAAYGPAEREKLLREAVGAIYVSKASDRSGKAEGRVRFEAP